MKKILSLALSLLLLVSCSQPTAREMAAPPEPMPEAAPEVTPEATPEPTPPPADQPAPPEQSPAVWTDWSHLTPYQPEKQVFTRRYEGFTDTLHPADDYGELIPFSGAILSRADNPEWLIAENGFPEEENYILSGLVTRTGEVVVDPVFTSAYQQEERDWFGNLTGSKPFLLLSKTVVERGAPLSLSALAATDGSWCTDFLYEFDWESGWNVAFEGGLTLQKAGDRLALVDPTNGKELREVDYSAAIPDLSGEEEQYYFLNGYAFDKIEGWCTLNIETSRRLKNGWEEIPLLYDPQGQPVPLPQDVAWIGTMSDGLAPARNSAWNYGFVDTTGAWAIPPTYENAQSFFHGYAPVRILGGQKGGWTFIDREGNTMTRPLQCASVQLYGDYWYLLGDGWELAALYKVDTLELVASPLMDLGTVSFRGKGWVSCHDEQNGETVLARGYEVHCFPDSLGNLDSFHGDVALFTAPYDPGGPTWLTIADLEGNVLATWEGAQWGSFRTANGEDLLAVSYLSEQEERTDLYTPEGAFVTSLQGWREQYLGGGLRSREEEDRFTIETLDGEVIFSWHIPQNSD